jgi:hypothetical protein
VDEANFDTGLGDFDTGLGDFDFSDLNDFDFNCGVDDFDFNFNFNDNGFISNPGFVEVINPKGSYLRSLSLRARA